jgi:hypothetical protein
MISLTNTENPSSSPLCETYSGFQKAAYDSQFVPEAQCVPEIVSKDGHNIYTGENYIIGRLTVPKYALPSLPQQIGF